MVSTTVKFKSTKAAEEFAAAFSVLGERVVVEIKEATAVISSVDPRAIRFVKHTSNDLLEETRCRGMANRLLSTITECIFDKKDKTIKLMSNDEQKITPHQAQVLASMYDRLSEENQMAFLVLASENKDTYTSAVNFARTNEENA